MQVHCRCGQVFTIQAERYPHKVSCHQCGRHFDVFDDGDAIHRDAALVLGPDARLLEAIQTEPILSLGETPTRAICTDQTRDRLELLFESTSADAKLEAELKVIDLHWHGERDLHSVIPLFGITIPPTRPLSFWVAGLFAFAWSCLIGMLIVTGQREWVCSALVGMAVSGFFPAYIFRKSNEYEKAEAEWQRKRVIAIAKAKNAGIHVGY